MELRGEYLELEKSIKSVQRELNEIRVNELRGKNNKDNKLEIKKGLLEEQLEVMRKYSNILEQRMILEDSEISEATNSGEYKYIV